MKIFLLFTITAIIAGTACAEEENDDDHNHPYPNGKPNPWQGRQPDNRGRIPCFCTNLMGETGTRMVENEDLCAGRKYLQCPSGTHRDIKHGMCYCLACPSGTYQPIANINEHCRKCPTCPPGEVRVGCGGSSRGACVTPIDPTTPSPTSTDPSCNMQTVCEKLDKLLTLVTKLDATLYDTVAHAMNVTLDAF